jgi:uncharacterized protein
MGMNPSHTFIRSIRKTALVSIASVAAVGTFMAFSADAASTPAVSTQAITQAVPAATVRTIIVHGSGKALATPNQVTVTLGVETNAKTAQAALKDNNTKADELVKLLKSAGIDAKDIQTYQLSAYPQYDNTGRKLSSYQVTNTVTATIRNLAKAGEIIDQAAASAGDAIRIQSVSFSLSDESPAMASSLKTARANAVADARLQAEQLATAAGVKLGALRTISAGNVSAPPVVLDQGRQLDVAAKSVPLEAGSQQITADVDLVFEFA